VEPSYSIVEAGSDTSQMPYRRSMEDRMPDDAEAMNPMPKVKIERKKFAS